MAQYITINLKKDVIVMKLSEKATQADTIKSLKKKLPELKKLYQQEKTPIFVTGRILKNKELKESYIDEKNGIEYRLVGDYYVPNLIFKKEEKIILNKYGRARLKFLKENRKAEYTIMFINVTLNKHLKEIQVTAD